MTIPDTRRYKIGPIISSRAYAVTLPASQSKFRPKDRVLLPSVVIIESHTFGAVGTLCRGLRIPLLHCWLAFPGESEITMPTPEAADVDLGPR